ncbi:MAG: LysE family translocator [Corynebacterium sp.]|uniref:LysE family translocator n=1 Tax=Corynebacterium sp. TaxID=1720 RepID=UPI0026DFCC89|nr:LysE family translocator [Corynebacterium sp.]MDO5668691.1 LysE family translocator [Corynebacterium sp.]
MSLAQWAALVVLNIAGAASPGPDILLITRTAIRSRRHAVATVLGIQVGVLFWCTLTVLGFAALLNAFPAILGFLQLIGGAWLVWMGYGMVSGGLRERKNPPADLEEAAARLGRLRHAFLHGLTTNLSNPKIVLFLSALIAPLLPQSPSAGLAIGVVAALSISAIILQLGMALLVSTPAMRRKLLRAGPMIDVAAGIFFIVAGLVLVFNGVEDLQA